MGEVANGWIYVGDALPQLNHTVLVWIPSVECTSTASLMAYGQNEFAWYESGAVPGETMSRKVTHWQPCPKGPE